MMRNPHAHSALIDQIGAKEVRRHFGIPPRTLYNWRARGIPQDKRLVFARLALDHSVIVPVDFLVREPV